MERAVSVSPSRHKNGEANNTHTKKNYQLQASTNRGDIWVRKLLYRKRENDRMRETSASAACSCSAHRERDSPCPAVTVDVVPPLQQVRESVHVADAVRPTVRVPLAAAAAKPTAPQRKQTTSECSAGHQPSTGGGGTATRR